MDRFEDHPEHFGAFVATGYLAISPRSRNETTTGSERKLDVWLKGSAVANLRVEAIREQCVLNVSINDQIFVAVDLADRICEAGGDFRWIIHKSGLLLMSPEQTCSCWLLHGEVSGMVRL